MKRFISLLLCVVVLASLTSVFTVSAYADDNDNIQLFGYALNDTALDVVIYARASEPLNVDDFTIEVEGEKLKPDRLTVYEDSGYSTSWIIIVEPTAYNQVATLVTNSIERLVGLIQPNDNVAVMNASNLALTDYSRAFRDLLPMVKETMGAGTPSFLFDALSKGMDALFSDANLSMRKNLVFFTEGRDADSHISFPELCGQAMGLPITIYHIGITRGDPGLTDTFDTLQAFVMSSDSSDSYVVSNIGDPDVPISITDQILGNEQQCFVLSVDREHLPAPASDPSRMEVSFVKNGMRFSEAMNVTLPEKEAAAQQGDEQNNSDNPSNTDGQGGNENTEKEHEHSWIDATCTEPKTCALCGETEGEALGHDYSTSNFFKTGVCSRCGDKKLSTIAKMWVWIKTHYIVSSLIALALIAAIVLIVRAIIRKKKAKKEKFDEMNNSSWATGPVFDNGGEGTVPLNRRTASVSGARTENIKPKVTVQLTNIENGQVLKGEIYDKVLTAGRSSKFKLTGDGTISNKQMSFIWDSGILYLQDEKSTNGTKVNDRKIDTAVQLNQKDLIHVGKTDYRVTWKVES